MKPIDNDGAPELSEIFTSALADMEISEMTALIRDNIRTPGGREIEALMEDYADMTVEELGIRAELIEEFVRSRGASGTTPWLTDFLIDVCMTEGVFDIELALAHAQIMRHSIRSRKHRYRLDAFGGDD